MRRMLCLLLVCAVVPAGLVAGCGGGAKKSGPVSGLSIAQAKKRNRVSEQQSYQSCEQALANPGLTATEKPLMQQECADIQSHDETALRQVSNQLCKVEAQVEPEPERSTMLSQCPKP